MKTKGFTLLELLIVLAASSLFLLAIHQLFFHHQQQYHQQKILLETQENYRISLHLLKNALQAAGEAGCQSVPLLVSNQVTYSPVDLKILQGYALYGFYGHEAGWSPALPNALMGKVMPNTDVVMVEKASYERANLAQAMIDLHAPIYTTQSQLFSKGDIALIVDCEYADLFVVNDMANGINGQIIYPNQLSRAYGVDAQVMRWQMDAYYLAVHDDGTSGLYKKTLLPDLPAVEWVLGIDQFRVQYGVLVGGSAGFINADVIHQWADVRGLLLSVQTGEQLSSELNVVLYN